MIPKRTRTTRKKKESRNSPTFKDNSMLDIFNDLFWVLLQSIAAGRSCLELGAGTGVVGLTLGSLGAVLWQPN